MIESEKITGRLGNQLFQIAFLYAFARDNNLPLVDNALGYYYQDVKHFAGHEDKIKALFRSGVDMDCVDDRVAIHVRRGDYVGNKFYVDLMETDYYEKAIKHFPNAQFLVFSDDIPWCMEQDIFKGMSFSGGLSDIGDLNHMMCCKGIITANSSFSFWAAYLSNAEKIITPKKWFTDGIKRVSIPEGWIQI